MEDLINYFLLFGNLNKQQTDLIAKKVTVLELRKEEYFSEAGKVPQQVGFLIDGILRVCYYNNKGEEITRYFIDEINLVVDIKNFEAHTECTEYVQAVTDCKMIVFSKQHWNELSNTIIDWHNITNKIFKKALIEKLERKSPLIEQDATTRYVTFLEKYPQIVSRIPLSYLASYLGITQSSLSRIRKNIS